MISYAIMAHPARAPLVEPLLRKLGREAALVWDEGRGEWDTGRRSLLAYDPAAEWHAVIQDDAILSDRFVEALELVTANAGEHPLGLYFGRVRPNPRVMSRAVDVAEHRGSPWIEWQGPRWGVAICLPTRYIPALVASADLYRHPHYDARVSRFFKMANVTARYPVPSLVDHDPTIPSLLDSAGGDRRAYRFLGADDPNAIDWEADPVVIDRRGYISIPARA
jgi:hypothetical protein